MSGFRAYLLAGGLLAISSADALAQDRIQYNRDIRPLLAENCWACHGPDKEARKGKLRLDERDEAVKREVIIPGKPDESELIRRVMAPNARDRMPPEASHKTLTAVQKETLKRWVAQGAEYQGHWAFIAATRPALPQVKNQQWIRNPIDRFVLSKLEAAGIKPAPEADRRTLARRLSLDLTGLPPEPKAVEEFVNDMAPNAYEKYVDKLMQSPHWGEHRARYWLDVARYADTHGLHFDNFREMWSYRDWVIDAFNRNLPFDQFTIEQLAGDLLPERTLDQLIASGFNRCNITTNEGGTIVEENLVHYTRDRTETVAQVFLGLTAGCAVCHDHKYDPFSQRDFYSMAAFFNNTTQGGLDGNIRDTPPIAFVPSKGDRLAWDGLAKKLKVSRDEIDARKKAARSGFDTWLTSATSESIASHIPTQGLSLHAPLNEGKGITVGVKVNGEPRLTTLESGFEWKVDKVVPQAFTLKAGESIEIREAGDFEKDQSFSVGAWIKVPRRGTVGSIVSRMDSANSFRGWDLWMEADRIGMHIVHKWSEDAIKVLGKTTLQPNQWYHVLATYNGSGKASGVKVYLNGQVQAVDVAADTLKQTIRTTVPLKVGQRSNGERMPVGVAMHDVRLYANALAAAHVEQVAKGTRALAIMARPAAKRSAQEKDELYDWWLPTLDMPYQQLKAKLRPLEQEEATLKSRGTIAHVMSEAAQEPIAYVLFRGDYDKRRDKVKAETPKALPAMAGELPRNRLGFAKWLLRPENPLTARVTVNRFWQEVFGNGLVRSSGDFGITGELPTHPELLDWLAVEFRESGWDIQKFFKLIVTSATYRQSAAGTKESREKDLSNMLLSRAPRHRLDAEMLRDYALASSSLLVRKIGGASVKPYQPEGVWEAVAMIGSNTRDYKRDSGEKLYRRSMYTFWKRGAPPAAMDILNAPNREFCTVRRERTNTPLQALVTMNDPQLVEAARHLAQTAIKEGGEKVEGRLDVMARRLLARPFRPEEAQVLSGLVAEMLTHYQSRPEEARKLITVGESQPDATVDAATLAALTVVANQLMNLDEVLNK